MKQNNKQFAKDFLQESKKRGHIKNMMSDVVGMPDAQDEEFLRKLIARYEQLRPGLLGYTIREARRRFEAGTKGNLRNTNATVNAASNMRYDFELPEDFVIMVEKYFPTMFRDKKHYGWFKRKLPGLMVRPK